MAIVSNSGPILSFARARHFDLLREGFSTLTIPEAVYPDIRDPWCGEGFDTTDLQDAEAFMRNFRDNTSIVQTSPRSGACILALFCFSTWRSRYGSMLCVARP